MAAELVTPTDEKTGFPLPIIPSQALIEGRHIFTNWHHVYHPNSSAALMGLGGRALRNSRIQLVDASHHNHGKNSYHAIYKGFEMPDFNDPVNQFKLALLGITGFIPRRGIDMDSDSYAVRDLTPAEVSFLRQPAAISPVTSSQVNKYLDQHDECNTPKEAWKTLYKKRKRQAAMSYKNLHYSYDDTKTFFTDYVLSEDKLDVNLKIKKRFMAALALEQYETAIGLGESIIERAAEVSAEPVRPIYKELYRNGLLHKLVPEDPAKIVKHKLGNFVQRQGLYPELQKRLGQIAA